jgi:hypothetical protein
MSNKKIKRLRDLNSKEKKEFLMQVIEFADQLTETFSEILSENSESITDAVEKHSEVVLPLLRKAKLWYFQSMPIEIARDLRQLAEQEMEITVEKIEQVFIDYYSVGNYDILKRMVLSWFDSPFFDKRKVIIEDALGAHMSGKFTLSIPALLPQVEGILSGKTNHTAGRVGWLLKDAVERNSLGETDVFDTLEGDLLIALATDPFLFKGHIGEFFSPEKYAEWLIGQGIENTPLNRDAILHGVQIDYATEINSLRVFFLLDSIYWIDNEKLKVVMNRL